MSSGKQNVDLSNYQLLRKTNEWNVFSETNRVECKEIKRTNI